MAKGKTENKQNTEGIETKKVVGLKDAFYQMQRAFSGECGIAISNLQNLYNLQMKDILANFANKENEIVALRNKVAELEEEVRLLKSTPKKKR